MTLKERMKMCWDNTKFDIFKKNPTMEFKGTKLELLGKLSKEILDCEVTADHLVNLPNDGFTLYIMIK